MVIHRSKHHFDLCFQNQNYLFKIPGRIIKAYKCKHPYDDPKGGIEIRSNQEIAAM
jgi:hypothetical protein